MNVKQTDFAKSIQYVTLRIYSISRYEHQKPRLHGYRACHPIAVITGTIIPSFEQESEWVINFNTLRPRQNGRHFADDTFKRIFLNENVKILIKISLKFVPKSPINNIPALVQIMAWRRPGDKPLSESMMVSLLTHICVTRPQWVKSRSWTSNIEAM